MSDRSAYWGASPPNDGRFQTTRWTTILAAAEGDDGQAGEALGAFAEIYRAPMVTYVAFLLRQKGLIGQWESEDLVQEFFQRKILEGEVLKRVNRDKVVRFRGFLRLALRSFVIDCLRGAQAAKRGGGQPTIELEAVVDQLAAECDEPSAINAMDKAWAFRVLDRAVARMEVYCASARGERHWRVFSAMFLEDGLRDIERISLSAVAKHLEVATAKQLKQSLNWIGKHFSDMVREEIRDYTMLGDQVDLEFREVLQVLTEFKRIRNEGGPRSDDAAY